ncbi:MAG: hypothetical protein IJ795_00835 [Bacteroidales bacterium]|nr:hypothetical protein [Bacteroidales bacterium]
MKSTLFGISTNLAYDAATAINICIEVPVAGNWDIRADYTWTLGNPWR